MSPSHIIVADCECITKKITQPGKDQEHIPVINCLYVIPNTNMIAAPLDIVYVSFEDNNCMEDFCVKQKEISKEV